MTWEAIFLSCVILLTIYSFITEKLSPDMTALGSFSVLLVASLFFKASSLPSIKELLSVFSSEAPLTIAAMFVINTALEKCGVIDKIAKKMDLLTRLSYPFFILFFILIVSAFSTFMNNTAVVMILLPVALSLSRKANLAPSKVLIPLSYASIFGGCCTLIGTSTNILASGIAVNQGLAPIAMFELAYVGVPLTFASAIYIAIFGDKMLPARETLYSILPQESRKEFIIEAILSPLSPLVGVSFKESEFFKTKGIRLVELIRDGQTIQEIGFKLQAKDRLILACNAHTISKTQSIKGLEVKCLDAEGMEKISTQEASIVEAIIPPNSNIIGQTLKDINFFQQFRTILIAIHRKGVNLHNQLKTLQITAGDTLLLMGSDIAIESLSHSANIIVLDRSRQPAQNLQAKAPIVLITLACVVLLSAFNFVPIVVGSLIGVAILLSAGCIKPQQAYNCIEWRILIIIYSSLAIGLAMESTGLALFIGNQIATASDLFISEGYQPFFLFAACYLVTAILTEVLSNNATVVIMAPISISIALSIGVDPRPFLIATCIGASNAFATPIGYQTNTYVYTIGGYRFGDFFKIGCFINLIYLIGVLWIVPKIWPF